MAWNCENSFSSGKCKSCETFIGGSKKNPVYSLLRPVYSVCFAGFTILLSVTLNGIEATHYGFQAGFEVNRPIPIKKIGTWGSQAEIQEFLPIKPQILN